MKKLELEAEKYARKFDSEIKNEYEKESLFIEDKIEIEAFVAGATSKFVEKQKIYFAIEQLNQLKNKFDSLNIFKGTIKECIDVQQTILQKKLNKI